MFESADGIFGFERAREAWGRWPAAARAAVLVAAGSVVVGAWLAWQPAGEQIPVVFDLQSGAGDVRGDSTQTSVPATVVVHVVGAVRHPGVYCLAAGSRVGDALDRAGGALGNAAVEAINLARVLSDGEQVFVPTKDEASAAVGCGVSAPAPAVGAARKVNVNTATAEELDALPGIGPATAQKIVEDRARNGPFSAPEDLMRVPGIGSKKFEALKDLVTTR